MKKGVEVQTDHWWSCYDEGLKGLISDVSMAHPAKVSFGLAKRIYRHLFEEGWVEPGSVCLDPMAGVATFGLVAATFGLRWLGVELEERFCAFGQGNIALHTKEWLALGKPLPLLVQGDARALRGILAGLQAGCVVSSPPYADGCRQTGGIDAHPEHIQGGHNGHVLRQYSELSAVISSPPYANSVDSQACGIDWTKMGPATGKRQRGPGTKHHETLMQQLSYQPQAIVSSPPFLDARQDTTPSIKGKTAPTKHDPEAWSQPSCVVSSPPYANAVTVDGRAITDAKTHTRPTGKMEDLQHGYGPSTAQLGAMREGSLAAVISSPPYAEGLSKEHTYTDHTKREKDSHRRIMTEKGIVDPFYGTQEGNLGNGGSTTYWSEMLKVYEACRDMLPVGGHIILVVKGYIKRGVYQDLPHQTAQLLEHVGFTMLHEHHAMLSSPVGQAHLFDDGEDRTRRASFFRRLAEKNGAPVIDHESVLCAVKTGELLHG